MLLISLPLGERDERVQATMGGGLRKRRSCLRGQLAERRRWMPQPQLGDLGEVLGQLVEHRASESPRAGGARRGAVRTRFASSAFASRFARARVAATTACSSRRSAVVARAGQREQVEDRLVAFRVRDGVRCGARRRASVMPSRAATSAMKRAPVEPTCPQLEMRVARAGQRAAAEQRAAEVGTAAARPADHALRRLLERRARSREHAGLPEHRQRVRVDLDVELVARRLVERAAAVSADLGAHTEVAQERERASRGRGARQVEVDRDRAAAQVPRAGGVEESRQLGLAAAAPLRRDLRQLVAQLLRERASQSTTSSSSSIRRLYPTPRPPQLPRPFAATTRWTGRNGARSQRAQNVPAARAAPGRPASAASSP